VATLNDDMDRMVTAGRIVGDTTGCEGHRWELTKSDRAAGISP
jgi:hypothetical protein